MNKDKQKQPSERDILASEARKAMELMREALDLDAAMSDIWEDQ